MFYELNKTDFNKTDNLFRLLEHQPMCEAVLEGIYPGRVFVDDPDEPRTALLTTILSSENEGVWGFLVGDPDNQVFNQELNQAIFSREIIGKDVPVILLTCHPEDWHGHLETVFAPRPPAPMPRRHYLCRQLKLDWRSKIPNGFTVQRMDQSLLSYPGLEVPDEVRRILRKWRANPEARFKDFGFAAIQENPAERTAAVASWATVDFIAGEAGEAGFFTEERYRRGGLGTVTAAAAVDYGLNHGLSLISWTCSADNTASIRTAEKLGFERSGDYKSYLLIFDEANGLSQMAYQTLLEGNYSKVIELYEQFFKLKEEAPEWASIDIARAWAGLGNTEKATANLRMAIDKGWTDIKQLESYKEFDNLRNAPEWARVLESFACFADHTK